MEDKSRILRSGVRIFPIGVQEDSYNKSSVEESKNAARRTARGIRRGYDRYKLRRKQLRRILLALDMLPERLEMPSARSLYELRVRALDEKLALKELGRILLHLNQRRGFKSNRKAAKKADEDETGIKLEMTELKNKVHGLGFRTLGEYFYSLYVANERVENWHNDDEPVERLRKRWVHRSMYEEEFDLIWRAQAAYHPSVLTEEKRREIKERCIYYQRPLKSQKGRVGKCRFEPKKRVAPKSSLLFQEFRIWETLNRIRVTDGKRNMASLTLAEMQNAANALNEASEITKTKLRSLIGLSKVGYLNDIDKIKGNTTAAKILGVVGLDEWRGYPEEKKNHIWHVLYFAPDESWLKKWAMANLGLTEEAATKFGEIPLEPDYSRISHKAITKVLPFLKQGLGYAEACKAAGYHHSFDEETQCKERELEEKIIRKPNDEIEQLRNPMVMRAVSETVALVNALIQEEGRPDRIRIEFARSMKMPKEVREKMRNKNRDKDRQRDDYREFLKRRLGWADVTRSQITKFELWLEMEFAEEDLRKINASVNVEEFRKFAKNVKPGDRVKYDLWLECGRVSPYTGKTISLTRLFSSDIEIEHILPYSRTMDNSFRNKTISEREFNAAKGNQTPFEYFQSRPEELKAFEERIKRLPTGKQRKMVQEEFEQEFRPGMIESTATIAKETRNVLRRVCKDVRATDGQVTSILRRWWGLNRILNTTDENEKSRNDHRHHAVDAFVIANTDDWWINLLSQASTFDGSGRQSLDSKKLDAMLRTDAGRKLAAATGAGTTTDDDPLGLTEHVSLATGEIITDLIPGPYEKHREDLVKVLSSMLISYKNDKRLLTSKKNIYRYSNPKSGEKQVQKILSIRGPLHSESVFGLILNPQTGESEYVIRKQLSTFDKMKQVDRIVDQSIKELVKSHIERNGGEARIKEALQKPLFMVSNDGKKRIPVHTVRISDPATRLIQLRPKENAKLYVDSGSNFCIAIYEEPLSGNRAFETISFYEAARRAAKGETVIPLEKDGVRLLQWLKQKDLVVRYKLDPEEIRWDVESMIAAELFYVIKVDTAGQIFLGRHTRNNLDAKVDRNRDLFQVRASTIKVCKVGVSTTGKLVQK